jgi:hypothetical protein
MAEKNRENSSGCRVMHLFLHRKNINRKECKEHKKISALFAIDILLAAFPFLAVILREGAGHRI